MYIYFPKYPEIVMLLYTHYKAIFLQSSHQPSFYERYSVHCSLWCDLKHNGDPMLPQTPINNTEM